MRALRWLGIELVEVSLVEKLVSALGSTLAILSVFLIARTSLPSTAAAAVIASMGASAVLLFAVPHGQLSQPWPLVGGHTLSALIGVCCAKMIVDPALATALAVGTAIGVMHQLKCIHPPGGATAFTAVMGGQSIRDLGFGFVVCPVLLNAALMLGLAVIINYPFFWRRYPAAWIKRADQPTAEDETVSEEVHQVVIGALRSLDSFVDVSEDDLLYLTEAIASQLTERPAATPSPVRRN